MNVWPQIAGASTITPPPYCSTNQPCSGSSRSAAANSICAGCPWNRTRSPRHISSPDMYRNGSGIPTSVRALHPHHGDLREPLLENRRLQLFCHPSHHLFAHHAIARPVALKTNLKWNIKEHSLNFVSKALSHLDPLPPLVDREIRRIDVIPRHLGNQSRTKQRPQ